MSFVRSLPGLLMYNSASRHTENKTKKHATSHTDRLATSSTAADLCPTHENLGMFYFAHFDFFKVWCFYKCIYCIIEYFPPRRNLPFWLSIDWKKKNPLLIELNVWLLEDFPADELLASNCSNFISPLYVLLPELGNIGKVHISITSAGFSCHDTR